MDLRIGWERSLYVKNYGDVASFDPTGKKRWTAKLPDAADFGGDASGNVYGLGYDDKIFRVGPDGSVDTIVEDGHLPGHKLVVQRDGTLLVFGSSGSVAALKADGTILWRKGEDEEDD